MVEAADIESASTMTYVQPLHACFISPLRGWAPRTPYRVSPGVTNVRTPLGLHSKRANTSSRSAPMSALPVFPSCPPKNESYSRAIGVARFPRQLSCHFERCSTSLFPDRLTRPTGVLGMQLNESFTMSKQFAPVMLNQMLRVEPAFTLILHRVKNAVKQRLVLEIRH